MSKQHDYDFRCPTCGEPTVDERGRGWWCSVTTCQLGKKRDDMRKYDSYRPYDGIAPDPPALSALTKLRKAVEVRKPVCLSAIEVAYLYCVLCDRGVTPENIVSTGGGIWDTPEAVALVNAFTEHKIKHD